MNNGTLLNATYSRLDDVTVDHCTGYTNIFLTAHNDLFPSGKPHGKQYSLVAEKAPSCPNYVYSTMKDLECTPLMARFMSKENLDHLQQAIIDIVRQRSKGAYQISRQSDDELLIIMRAMYLQYSRNLPTDLAGQVKELNRQVLLYAIPNIMARIDGYLAYRYEQQTPNKFLSYAPDVRENRRSTFTGDFSSLII